jgi:hypothetical protein
MGGGRPAAPTSVVRTHTGEGARVARHLQFRLPLIVIFSFFFPLRSLRSLPLPLTITASAAAATPLPAPASLKVHKLRSQLEDLRHAVAGLLGHGPMIEHGDHWNPRLRERDRTIERRPHSDAFTAKQFHDQYESKGRPVIITHHNAAASPPYWSASGADYGDLEWWKKHCGDGVAAVRVKPNTMRPNNSTADFWSWPMHNVPLAHYIDFMLGNLTAQAAGFPAAVLPLPPSRTYLFDWPISECPDPTILDDLIIPRIFANDMLTLCRVYDGSNGSKRCPYNNANWPSLFIGNPSLKGSPLHRDTFGSAFFSIQLRGRKRWRVFAAADAPFLYPSLDSDVKFEALDTFKGAADHFPLIQIAGRADAVVGENDLFYVPAGSPHQVEMIETAGDEVNVMLALNYVSAANLDRVIETTAPRVLEEGNTAFSQRLYTPLHDFFAVHKASMLKNVDWRIGHMRYRDFVSRSLPHVCESKLAFSVDGRRHYATINMLSPDVDASARTAARMHPRVDGLEESLRAGLVRHLRPGATRDCQEDLARLLNSRIRRHQKLLPGFCPAFAMADDFEEVGELIFSNEAARLIAWARAQMEGNSSGFRVNDSVDGSPSYTFDLPLPTLRSLAEIMMAGQEPTGALASRRLQQRLLSRLWPAFAALPVAAGDARLDSPGWLEQELWNSPIRDDVYGFVRLYSKDTRKGLQMHRDSAMYSVNIALNEGSEFEGGDLVLALGGERDSSSSSSSSSSSTRRLYAPTGRRAAVGSGIAFGANVPHGVTEVTWGQRWSLVLFFTKVRDDELPPCFTDFQVTV